MYYEKESGALNFIAGLAIGAILGASVALLTAPQSGKRTRRKIVRVVEDARDRADDVRRQVVRKGRRRIRHA